MDINEIDFSADDARRIVDESYQRKEFIYYKFHANIVNQIRQRSSKRLYHMVYTLPVYLFGAQVYDPPQVLRWLVEKLRKGGFQVDVDYERRKLFISWEPPKELSYVSSGYAKRRPAKKKSVSFDTDKNLFHHYSHH